MVGKYTGLKDAYKSLIEALHHGGIANTVKVNLEWIEVGDARERRPEPASRLGRRHPRPRRLRPARLGRHDHAPPGSRAQHKVPFFGICFGMQMAVVEAARNLVGLEEASSTEFGADAPSRWSA